MVYPAEMTIPRRPSTTRRAGAVNEPRAEVVRRRGWMGASREPAGARRRGRTVALVYETVRRRPWRILMTTAASLWGTKTKWIFGRNNKGNREGLSRRVPFLDDIPGTNCWRWRIWSFLTRFWHSLLVLQENWTRHASILHFSSS